VIRVGKYLAYGGLGEGPHRIDPAAMVWAAVSVKREREICE